MPTTRCPVVRLQSGSYGARGFTTDYHDWSGEEGRCKFCGISRRDAQTKDESGRPGWRGFREQAAYDAEHEFGVIMSTRPTREDLLPYSPNPDRWASIMRLLASN